VRAIRWPIPGRSAWHECRPKRCPGCSGLPDGRPRRSSEGADVPCDSTAPRSPKSGPQVTPARGSDVTLPRPPGRRLRQSDGGGHRPSESSTGGRRHCVVDKPVGVGRASEFRDGPRATVLSGLTASARPSQSGAAEARESCTGLDVGGTTGLMVVRERRREARLRVSSGNFSFSSFRSRSGRRTKAATRRRTGGQSGPAGEGKNVDATELDRHPQGRLPRWAVVHWR